MFEEVVWEGKKKRAPEASLLERFEREIIRVHNKAKGYLIYVQEMDAVNEMHPLHEVEAQVLCLTKELNGVAVASFAV